MAYAEDTKVTIGASQAEIQRLIQRYGAKRYATAYDEDSRTAVIQFDAEGLRVMFRLTLPHPDDFTYDTADRKRTAEARRNAYDKECRRLWRALALVIKAKLESVESGIESFEEAFLPQLLIPGSGGQTFSEFAVPEIRESYRTNTLPPLLGLPSGHQA